MFLEWKLMDVNRKSYVCLGLQCNCVTKSYAFVYDARGLSIRSYGTYYANGNEVCGAQDCINSKRLLPNGKAETVYDLLLHLYSIDVFTLTVLSTTIQNQSEHLWALLNKSENLQDDVVEARSAWIDYENFVSSYNETLELTLNDLQLSSDLNSVLVS